MSSRAAAVVLPPDQFASHGRIYRWREGDDVVTDPGARRHADRRGEIAGLFARAVVPGVERRGAAGVVVPAAPPAGVAARDVRWVAWHAQGDRAPVWGLYLAAHELGADAPANDAFALVAWGDGPVLAWADERDAARAALRAALREPPPWLLGGMRSRDVTFPVRIDRVAGPDDVGTPGAHCIGVVR